MSLILRSAKAFPLTNTELDGNFTFLNSAIGEKLSITDFNSTSVLLKITTGPQGISSGIDASKLRGLIPTDLATSNTIVARDTNGDFQARVMFASIFRGKADAAILADTATTALTLSTTLPILKGGTGTTTAAGARTALGAVNIAGDTLTGKLVLCPTTTSIVSINIPKTLVAPTSPIQGDVWHDTSGLKISSGGSTRTVAFLTSSITGTSSNITGIASIINGGTGKNNKDSARVALGAAEAGVNSDITQLTALNQPILVSAGGTGLTSSGPEGNFLVSTGTTWVSKDIGIPIESGAVMAYYRTTAPQGWLECNGVAVSRTTYASLWIVMGRPDTGNGTTTFNLPDLRGEFVRGWDHARNIDNGRALGSLQNHSLQKHTHYQAGYNLEGAGTIPWYNWANSVKKGNKDQTGDGTNSTIGTFSTETRPRNIALMYCIKT